MSTVQDASIPVPVLEELDWVRCSGCGEVLFRPRLRRLLGVCPACGHHERLGAAERIAQLLDAGSVRPLPVPPTGTDPLEFTDTRPYPQRLAQACARTGLEEAVCCVRARIHGAEVVVAVMDFAFLGGSLGCAVGEMITCAAEAALAERTPLLVVTASGGARMQEGALALMQMGKTAQALGDLDRAGVLTVSVVTDPTFGGVAASFATLCDVILAESGARLGFAGRRVIRQTIGEELPPEFQTAESVLANGLIDGVCPRRELREVLGRLLAVATGIPGDDGDGAGAGWDAAATRPPTLVENPALLNEADAWQTVRAARRLGRPTITDVLAQSTTEFTELHGDRVLGDCPAVLAGVGLFCGIPAAIVGTCKGQTAAELVRVNYGMPTPAGYRKAARVMRLAAKLGLPLVCLVDTPGAYPGRTAEEQGQALAIAENLRLMAGLPVPVVSVVTGEGGSGGALALSVADRVLMCSNAVYSVISPEGCAAILWDDAAAAPAAARALRIGARSMLELGVVDGVIREPDGGADTDPGETASRIIAAVHWTLAGLTGEEPAQRALRRRARWRGFGAHPSSGSAARPTDPPEGAPR